METVTDFIFLGSRITTDGDCSCEIKMPGFMEENLRQHIKKKRHHFSDQGLYSQSYGFFSRHVWMWELDHIEDGDDAFKLWCLRRLLLKSPLDLQGDQSSQSKRKSILNIHWRDWCWSWSSNPSAMTWRPDSLEKTLMLGKIEGRRRRGWQRTRWSDGITISMDMSLSNLREMVKKNGSLLCCSPWGRKESNTTDWLHNSNNFCLIFDFQN